ncbi:energy-coupling factor transporter transmembrane component T family protein [Morganella morganii]|uniref:energy-coupling factor transporter transmembrane component T family protein n=1 Tax=Morganella morganii TaxID=582 RepID=UPI0032DA689F
MDNWLPPHRRLLLAVIWAFLLSGIRQTDWLIAGLSGAFLLFIICRRRQLGRSLLTVLKLNIFILFVWLTLPWKIESQGIVQSPAGVFLALQITLKMNAILLFVSAMLTNMTDIDLACAVKRYPLPDKLIKLFILTIRYIAIFSETKQQLETAMKARGFRNGMNKRTFTMLSQLVALLLIKAMHKAETTEMALKARGFYARPSSVNTKRFVNDVPKSPDSGQQSGCQPQQCTHNSGSEL